MGLKSAPRLPVVFCPPFQIFRTDSSGLVISSVKGKEQNAISRVTFWEIIVVCFLFLILKPFKTT